ncbi:hypothetical protein Droror1_Dr00024078 [Drosera rotundifolia]
MPRTRSAARKHLQPKTRKEIATKQAKKEILEILSWRKGDYKKRSLNSEGRRHRENPLINYSPTTHSSSDNQFVHHSIQYHKNLVRRGHGRGAKPNCQRIHRSRTTHQSSNPSKNSSNPGRIHLQQINLANLTAADILAIPDFERDAVDHPAAQPCRPCKPRDQPLLRVPRLRRLETPAAALKRRCAQRSHCQRL